MIFVNFNIIDSGGLNPPLSSYILRCLLYILIVYKKLKFTIIQFWEDKNMGKREDEIKKWIEKIEKEAYDLGVDYFFAVANGMNDDAIVRSNNLRNNSNIADCRKFWNNLKKVFTPLTFKNVYEYIQQADRNEFGYHFPFENDTFHAFHIYNGLRQVNINVMNDNSYLSICNLIFDPEAHLVKIVKVNENGIADYDDILEITWDSSLCDSICLNHIGTNWSSIKEFLRDAIGPFVAKKGEYI